MTQRWWRVPGVRGKLSRMPIRRSLSLAIAALLLIAAPAQAAPTVSNTSDSGPGSLRQAIVEAGPGETITVPSGTYSLSTGPLRIEKSLTVTGKGSSDTIVRSVGPFSVFEIEPPAGKLDVTLSEMMIRDGRVFAEAAIGGGVFATETNLTLRRVNLTGNVVNANGEPGEAGGTAIGGGGVVILGTLTLVESVVSGNTAEALGAPEFEGGSAQGGGIVGVGASFNIERSTISGNVVNAGGGRGPANAFQTGGAAVGGGLILNAQTGPSSIVASTVSGNTAEAPGGPGANGGVVAGGGLVTTSSNQPIALTNLTVAGNLGRTGPGAAKAGIGGGMLVVSEETSSTAITSSTISGNRLETAGAESGGGNVFAAGRPGSVSFRNSIVTAGVAPAGENCTAEPSGPETPLVSLGFNLDSRDQCGFKAAGDKVNTDPLLLPLQSFGGPTQTMAPAAGSPIIDQGAAFGLTGDQRGVQRPIELTSVPNSSAAGADGSDIGAYELQPSNALTLGKIKKNKKKGTATLSVKLPQPSVGSLTLKGKGLKTVTTAVTGQSQLKLKIAAKSKKIRKALKKKGKRKVKVEVTYTPTGNAAATQSRTTKLVKKKRKRSKAGKR